MAIRARQDYAARPLSPSSRWRVHAALLAVQLLFGLHPVAGAVALRQLSPSAIIGVRTLLGAPLLLLLARLWGQGTGWPTRRELFALAGLGLLGVTVNQLLFTEGLHRAGPVNAAVLVVTIPVLTLLVAILLGRESLSLGRVFGVSLALIGAAIVTRLERFDFSSQVAIGDLMLLGNSLSYATYLVLARPLMAKLGAAWCVAWVFVFGAIGALPLTGPALLAAPWAELSWQVLLALAFILLGPTLGAYGLNAYALRTAEASVVAVYVALQPFVGALAAWVLLGTQIDARTAIAGAVIVTGVLVASQTRVGSSSR